MKHTIYNEKTGRTLGLSAGRTVWTYDSEKFWEFDTKDDAGIMARSYPHMNLTLKPKS